MRYRIKIKTFKNGRKEYTPQVKMRIGWATINFYGKANVMYEESELDSREKALERIDKHYEGNAKKHSIEFEYINK